MRLKIIKLIYFLIISLIVVRLGYWQIIESDTLSAKAEDQRLTQQQVSAPRGNIYFNDGSVLVSTQPAYLVFVQPALINKKADLSKKDYAKKIAEILWEEEQSSSVSAEIDPTLKQASVTALENTIYDSLSQDLYWVSLGKKVSLAVKKRIEKLNLAGLGFDQASRRFYPEGSSSAHLLGFIGSDIYGSDTGYFGLEGFYNGELRGRKGLFTLEQDALGLPILIGNFFQRAPQVGRSLILNIDRTVQYLAEKSLQKGIEKYGAQGGSVVVLEPESGKVLAMASIPAYHPSRPTDYPKENFRNPVTVDSFEPGSTFKVIVMAAALNEGVIKPETTCDICDGPILLSGFSLRTWNNKYYPNTSMTDVIVHSDNTGMVFVGRKLGTDKFYDYLQKFGFGQSSGIDLQDEATPELRAKPDWQEIDLATASFGQGISVTALQVVRAVAAIANGGRLMEPQVVAAIRDGSKLDQVSPQAVSFPVNEETAKIVTEMMVKAVEEGEAKFAKPKGYRIAGKTGTAQIPIAGHYDPQKTIASFVGFAPADQPKFVMLVRYNQPTSSPYGSETAAPTFFEIAKELFLYYGIPPSE